MVANCLASNKIGFKSDRDDGIVPIALLAVTTNIPLSVASCDGSTFDEAFWEEGIEEIFGGVCFGNKNPGLNPANIAYSLKNCGYFCYLIFS